MSFTPSVAVDAVRRTVWARRRVTVDPVGDTLGGDEPTMRAIRSCTAVTPPWAIPLTLSPTRSTTPAIALTTPLLGPASGSRGCGPSGSRLLGLGQSLTQIGERGAAQLVADLREELTLFFLDVVAHVLHQHGDLGVEALVLRIEVGQFRQEPLDDVMLLEALQGDVLGGRDRLTRDRVEHLLLDRGVDRQLLDDPIDDLTLLDVCPITGLLESLEQLLDGLVVRSKKGDCIHRPTRTRGACRANVVVHGADV